MKDNNNVNSVEEMVAQVKMGLGCLHTARKLSRVNGRKVTKVYILCDGLYDVDGEIVYKYDFGPFSEECRTAAVKELKEMVSYYTSMFLFCLFPCRKNAPILVE